MIPQVVNKPTPMKSWDGVKGSKYYLVQTLPQFNEFIVEAKKQLTLAVDTETSGLDWVKHNACGIVVGWGKEHNYYLPIDHKLGEKQLDITLIIDELVELFANPNVDCLFWNVKYDLHILKKLGIEVKGNVHDGITVVHLLNENIPKALKGLSKKYISRDADKWEKVLLQWRTAESKRRRHEFTEDIKTYIDKNRAILENEIINENLSNPIIYGLTKSAVTAILKERVKSKFTSHKYYNNSLDDVSYDQVPLDIIAPYACADTHYTWHLFHEFKPELFKDEALVKLYENERFLTYPVLFDMEHEGINIDVPYLLDIRPKIEKQIEEFRKDIISDVGYEFSIDSNQQLVKALLSAGCVLTKLTKKSKEAVDSGENVGELTYCVDKSTLESLAATYEFADKILQYRGLQKVLNAYVISFPEKADKYGKIHSNYNANVRTGRMSSNNPNTQNIGNKDKTIRKAFIVPSSDYYYISIDYSQVELRLTAHHSQDNILLSCYPFNGKERDVHTITCADVVLNRNIDEIIKILADESHPEYGDIEWYRNIAKRVNFGIIYGAGPWAIQRQVSTPYRQVSVDECKHYIDKYFLNYIGVKEWINKTTYFAMKNGFVQNTFGRYRRLPDVKSSIKWERMRAARQGCNFEIQGDAADLFKTTLVRLNKFLTSSKALTRVVNTVHDDVQFYWHKSELELLPKVKTMMEDFPQFSVPIRVDIKVSETDWGSTKKISNFANLRGLVA